MYLISVDFCDRYPSNPFTLQSIILGANKTQHNDHVRIYFTQYGCMMELGI